MKYLFFKVLILLFFFNPSSLFGDDKLYSFDIGLSPGLVLGSGYEYVFGDDQRTVSRLDWPMLPAASSVLSSDFNLKNGLHVSFISSFIIPSYSGSMFDYDYLNDYNPDMLTHFSEHDGYIKYGFDINVSVGWMGLLMDFILKSGEKCKIFVEPIIGFRYFTQAWNAVDGYIKYPPKTDPPGPVLPDTPIVPIKGIGISYKQSFTLPGIGLRFKLRFPKKWEMDLFTQISPNAFGYAEDIHYKRSLKFKDIFNIKGFSFYLYISSEKRFSKYFSFFSSIDYISIVSYNGKTFQYQVSTSGGSDMFLYTYHTGSAGSVVHLARLNLGLIFHLER